MRRLWDVIRRLHADDRGAEGLEKLLIIAALVLPLLGVLIWFREEIADWSNTIWQTVKGTGQGGTGGGTGGP